MSIEKSIAIFSGRTFTPTEWIQLKASFQVVVGQDKDGNDKYAFHSEQFVDVVAKTAYQDNLAFKRATRHKGEWVLWNGKAWERQIGDTPLVCDLVKMLEGENKGDRELTELYWTLANKVAVPSELFDKIPLTVTDSGAFYVQNRKLKSKKYNKQDYCTNYLPHKVEKFSEEGRKVWHGIIDKIFPNPVDQRCLQQIFGCCAFPSYQPQVIFNFHGLGGRGKSTITAILKAFLGTGRVSSTRLHEVHKDIFALAGPIKTSWVNLDDEAEIVSKEAELLYKSISGGDDSTIRDMREVGYDKRLQCKLIMISNDLPRWHDRSDAIWQRPVILPFEIDVGAEGEKYKDDIVNSMRPHFSGLLGWAFQGLADLLKNPGARNKQFAQSERALEIAKTNEQTSNPVLIYIDERIEAADANARIPRYSVYEDYKNWCYENGHKPLSSPSFGAQLARKCDCNGIPDNKMSTPKGRQRFWTGIRLSE